MEKTESLMRRYLAYAHNAVSDIFGPDYPKKNPRMVSELAHLSFEIEKNGAPFVAHEIPPQVKKKGCCLECLTTVRMPGPDALSRSACSDFECACHS